MRREAFCIPEQRKRLRNKYIVFWMRVELRVWDLVLTVPSERISISKDCSGLKIFPQSMQRKRNKF